MNPVVVQDVPDRPLAERESPRDLLELDAAPSEEPDPLDVRVVRDTSAAPPGPAVLRPRARVGPLRAVGGFEALASELRLELRGPRDDREDELALHRVRRGAEERLDQGVELSAVVFLEEPDFREDVLRPPPAQTVEGPHAEDTGLAVPD